VIDKPPKALSWKHSHGREKAHKSPYDPVRELEAGGWVFWDEVWARSRGVFNTNAEARAALRAYYNTHLEDKEEN